MTTTENNRDEVQQALEHDFEVLVGRRVTVKGKNHYDAQSKALDEVREKYPDAPASYAMALSKNYDPLTIRVPETLNQLEAHDLLQWAIENADRERISWSELTELILDEENTEYQDVRGTLEDGGLDVEVFVAWAIEERPSMRYKYQATSNEMEALANSAVDAYLGEHSDNATFAYEYYLDAGELINVAYELENAIDWDAVWDSALCHDITRIETFSGWNGHYFRTY